MSCLSFRPLLLILGAIYCIQAQDGFEWSTWFNTDHPGGRGDFEQLDVIRLRFPERVCGSPRALEARTADWSPASSTGERVHTDPAQGFWCSNAEQPVGRNCSDYAIRFLCPKGASAQDGWGLWSEWTPCSAQCGQSAAQVRTRSCSLLVRHKGQQCIGSTMESRTCKGPPCAALAHGEWGLWSHWTPCTAKCDEVAIQVRSRRCSSLFQHWGQQCIGPATEKMACKGSPCAVCSLQCAMGKANAECDACMCEQRLLEGSVRSAGGLPAPEAAILLSGPSQKLLTLTDRNGHFRIPGLCPDGNTNLTIRLQKHASLTVAVPHSAKLTSVLHVRLDRAEKLHVLSNPEHKVRREGQSAAFCCKVGGTPKPDQYQWFHNGSLLDQKLLKYGDMLVLRNLTLHQGGEYHCRASSEAGSIKSKPAMLTVIGHKAPSCNPKPVSHLIRLPNDCPQTESSSLYYDVGKCPTEACAGQLDKGIRCKDPIAYCCGSAKMERRQITCQGYDLPIMVVTKCGCQRCVEIKSTVRGRAVAADNGEPMRFGHIYVNGVPTSRTGYKGTFSIQVPPNTERLVLTFVDQMDKFVNTTKVLIFNKKGGAVYHEVKLLRKKAPVTLHSSETNILHLGEVEAQDPIAEIEIPPNTFYRENGEVFVGNVKASVTFLDPRDVSTANVAQSDLNFIDEEGDTLPLRTYGMFSVDFRDEEVGEPLNAGEVKVLLDSAQVRMQEHLGAMKLWSLNPETGLWEVEGDFRVEKRHRGKREERTFLIGNMVIRERRLFNLDVPENRRCYMKVRTFRGERFTPSEQVEGVVVSLINMEPTAGYSTNPRTWGRFDSVITGSNGACLPAFCDEERVDAYTAYVTANLGGEELEAVASSPKLTPSQIGVPQPYLSKFNYKRTDHEDPKLKKTAFHTNLPKPNPNAAEEGNGPMYSFENLKECEEASFAAGHFRFYRVEGDGYDYNTVPFNEDDPMSWTGDYLNWWPKPMEYRACYIKVKINGPHEVNIRSHNMGGTHPKTVGQLYGIRDTRSIRDMDQPRVSTVCLEFKCGGMLYDQERVDRTLVKVIPQGSCKRDSVAAMLQEYLVNHLPLAVNNDTNEFTMLAPLDPLGHNYGIYTVTDQDPRLAKEIALGRCFDGTSDGTSRVMKSNEGVALTFTCADREPSRQSIFQTLQNSPGQSLVSAVKEAKRNRRQRGGPASIQHSSGRNARNPLPKQGKAVG